jgi:hypothetical protein
MDVKLGVEQILNMIPTPDAWRSLQYTLHHPFLDEKTCTECFERPCECDVDSDEEDERTNWQCTLCNFKDMTKKGAECHLREPTHVKRMEEAMHQREEMMSVMRRWNRVHEHAYFKRLKKEDALSLPSKVLAPVYRYIKASTDEEQWDHSWGNAAKMLHQYENMERLSLLYLAVWKEECLAQMRAVYTISSAREWMANAWKQYKLEQRNSNTMSIIVSLVQPFLGNRFW